MALSVMQVTERLSKDAIFMGELERSFIRKLEEKQGPIPLYRRIEKLFTPDELAGLPLPGSKPPEQERGETDADYRVRLRQSNAIYDYYPETTRNGEKIPAGYRWNDIADGLNNDNIEHLDKLSKMLSTKVSAEEKAVVRASWPLLQGKSMAQLKSMHKTTKDRRSTFRTLTKRAFQLHLQMERIDTDYPAVDVTFHTIEGAQPDADGNLPIETTSAPILVINRDKPMFGEPLSVASFLRLNVTKALNDETQPGTYDALLRSGGKEPEPEQTVGQGGGVDLIDTKTADGYLAQLARLVDGKRGIEALSVMLTGQGSDETLLSTGDFFYALDGLMKGTLVQRYLRLRDERDAREEKEKQDRLSKDSELREKRTEATIAAANTAAGG